MAHEVLGQVDVPEETNKGFLGMAEMTDEFTKQRDDLIAFARQQKEYWVNNTESGDMCPYAIGVDKTGKVEIVAVATTMDKQMGIGAAHTMRRALGSFGVVLIADAHMAYGKTGESKDEFIKRLRLDEKSMQELCDQENACERGLMSDCLLINYCNEELAYHGLSLPYQYHGKAAGVPFAWTYEQKYADMWSLNSPAYRGRLAKQMIELMLVEPMREKNIPQVLTKLAELFQMPHPDTANKIKDGAYVALSGLGFDVYRPSRACTVAELIALSVFPPSTDIALNYQPKEDKAADENGHAEQPVRAVDGG